MASRIHRTLWLLDVEHEPRAEVLPHLEVLLHPIAEARHAIEAAAREENHTDLVADDDLLQPLGGEVATRDAHNGGVDELRLHSAAGPSRPNWVIVHDDILP